ncbi:hypothetical protein DFQ26_007964 [Actinomortierella ambigua]|nr:hypothetical protein DFQ26_007964 [Actinomortierella ambigua]
MAEWVTNVASLLVWFLLLGTPLFLLGAIFYCVARGTGSLAGKLIGTTAKTVREYQRQQMKKDKKEPPLEA